MKTTIMSEYSPFPSEGDSKCRVITDVSQLETQKMIFDHYQGIFIVFMNLKNIALFHVHGIILLKNKVSSVSIAELCWVTLQFSRASFLICIHSIWDTSLFKFVCMAVTRLFILGARTQSCKVQSYYLCVCVSVGTFPYMILKVIFKCNPSNICNFESLSKGMANNSGLNFVNSSYKWFSYVISL